MNILFIFSGEEHMLGPDSSYKYLTTDQMDSLADDSMPHPEVTDDEKHQKAAPNNNKQEQQVRIFL